MTSLQTLIVTLTGGDDERAEQAAGEIALLGAEALPSLRSLLDSDQTDERWWAVRAIAGIQEAAVDALLQQALHDEDASVRQCAALGFSTHPCPAAIPDLVLCLSGKDQLLARLAGNALVASGATSVPALIEVMEKGPQIARLEAVKALAEIGDERAVPVFFKAIQEGDSQLIEYWSDVGLEKLGVGMRFFKP